MTGKKNKVFRFTQASVDALRLAKSPSDRPEHRDSQTPGLVLRVSQTAKTFYFYGYDSDAKKAIKHRLGNSLELSVDDARRRALSLLSNPGSKSLQERVDEDSGALLFDNLLAAFDRDHIAKKLRPSGQFDYRYQIKKHIQPAFGHRPTREITRKEIRELFRARSEKAPVTANKMKVVLSSIFSYALREDLVDVNPVLGIPDNPTKPRRVILLSDDIKTFFVKLNDVEPVKRHYFWLLLLLGQRRGELTQLQWSQLEREDKWVIPENVTKNGVRHTVPLPPLARLHLDKLREKNGRTGFAFYCWETKHNRDTPGPYKPTHMTHWLRDFCCREMKDSTHFTVHDFRRTAATGLTTILKSQEIVKKVLNHVTNNPTDIYDLYAYDDEKMAALTKWEREVRKIVPQSVIDLSLRD